MWFRCWKRSLNMNRDYIVQRVKWIVASYTGVEPEDVEEDMLLSEFNLNEMDVILLLDKIEEEFECSFDTHSFSPQSTVSQIIDAAE